MVRGYCGPTGRFRFQNHAHIFIAFGFIDLILKLIDLKYLDSKFINY